ncbi:MAG: tetratricopeptide repeat protein [Acidobacteriota bacterium]|nr:tetratricopeptide repeat protein [Acidobacteriota bacterium]
MSEENQPVEVTSSGEGSKPSAGGQAPKTGWTSVQVYTMSALCLLVGIFVGYLFRGSTGSQTPAAPNAPAATAQQQMPGGMGQGMGQGQQQPTPEQMKAMAEKQVAPLLDKLKANPKDTDTMVKVGSFYLAARQFDEAQKYYQMAIDVKPTANEYTKLSNAQFYAGDGAKALSTLNQALKLDPKFPDALYNQGMLKWQVSGDVKGAIASWETLVKTNPNHPHIDQVKQMIERAREHEKIPAGTKTDKPAM